MFQPEHLFYLGKENGMDAFDYDGIHVYAMITSKSDGKYLYVGIGKNVPRTLRFGLLSWFGIDQQRDYTSCQLPDKSCFYYQKRQRRAA